MITFVDHQPSNAEVKKEKAKATEECESEAGLEKAEKETVIEKSNQSKAHESVQDIFKGRE